MKPIGPIPKKVKCISQEKQPSNFKVGGEYTVSGDGYIRFESDAESGVVWNSKSGNSKFQPIYTDEELLEYAKKMYPEGTEFFNSKGEYRKSAGVNYLINREDGCIDVQAFAKDGTRLAPDIYSPATGWVEIIEPSEDSVKQTYMFKEGDPILSKVHPGVTGFTVCGFEDTMNMYLICSPTWNEGHNGSGVRPVWGKVPDTSNNSCWWVHEDSIVLDNQLKEKDIDISQINVGDYVKIVDRPEDRRGATIWTTSMDYLYGTWQEVIRYECFHTIEVPAPTREDKDTWSINLSDITAVKSYNPSKCDVIDTSTVGSGSFACNTGPGVISNISVNAPGYDATVTDTNDDFITVDVAPSKLYADHFANSMRAPNFQMLRAMQTQYNMHQHRIADLIRDSEDYLMFGNKAKEDMLPVPSLRVSRKNIKK